MQARIPASIVRGGTSRGVFFLAEHLPPPGPTRDRFILTAFGSPDPYGRQIDGLGGATSTTSKVVIISPSNQPGCDVDYLFGQVDIRRPLVDYSGTCGNLSAAVGPFAIEEGLVTATDSLTKVRIWQVNTQKRIDAYVPTSGGEPEVGGDFVIDGIASPGAKIQLDYLDPGGSCARGFLPTGRAVDLLDIPGSGTLEVTLVDATTPVVIVRAEDIGLKGTELGDEIDAQPEVRHRLELIRSHGAVLMGLADTPEEATERRPATPKIAFVAPPQDYTTHKGTVVRAEEVSLLGRMMSMGTLHRTFAISGAIATVAAAQVGGSVAHRVARLDASSEALLLGHPSGLLPVGATVVRRDGSWYCEKATAYRTARRLMEGFVRVPASILAPEAIGDLVQS